MLTIVAISSLWTQYNNPGIRKLAGVKQLLRNAADEMTLVLTDVESTQALSQWNPSVRINQGRDEHSCCVSYPCFVMPATSDCDQQQSSVMHVLYIIPWWSARAVLSGVVHYRGACDC